MIYNQIFDLFKNRRTVRFASETDIPQEFKKRMGLTYFITGKTKFIDDRPSSEIIVYGKRKNKNGQWSKISNQLVIYKIRNKEEE